MKLMKLAEFLNEPQGTVFSMVSNGSAYTRDGVLMVKGVIPAHLNIMVAGPEHKSFCYRTLGPTVEDAVRGNFHALGDTLGPGEIMEVEANQNDWRYLSAPPNQLFLVYNQQELGHLVSTICFQYPQPTN